MYNVCIKVWDWLPQNYDTLDKDWAVDGFALWMCTKLTGCHTKRGGHGCILGVAR